MSFVLSTAPSSPFVSSREIGLVAGWGDSTRTETYLSAAHPVHGPDAEPGLQRPVAVKYRTNPGSRNAIFAFDLKKPREAVVFTAQAKSYALLAG